MAWSTVLRTSQSTASAGTVQSASTADVSVSVTCRAAATMSSGPTGSAIACVPGAAASCSAGRGGDELDGVAVGVAQLQRRLAELEDDAVVRDPGGGEVVGPGLERRAIGHRE